MTSHLKRMLLQGNDGRNLGRSAAGAQFDSGFESAAAKELEFEFPFYLGLHIPFGLDCECGVNLALNFAFVPRRAEGLGAAGKDFRV